MNINDFGHWLLSGLIIFLILIVAAFIHRNKKAKDNLGDKPEEATPAVTLSREYKSNEYKK